ncbi:MAG: OmpA family protein [Bacteroidota bacterium]
MALRFSILLYLIHSFACSSPPSLQAQATTITTIGDLSRREDRLLNEIRRAINLGEYPTAVSGLDRLLERNAQNVDLWFMRAAVQRYQGNYSAAAADFAQAIELAPDHEPEAYKALAELRQTLGEYQEATQLYEQYLSFLATSNTEERAAIETLIEHSRLAAQLVAKPVPFNPQPLSASINTRDHQEYFASISPDGQTLVFTRNLYGENEDFFQAQMTPTGQWGDAYPLSQVNTDFNEGGQTLSADGRLMVFTSCDKPRGFGGCDLYYSTKEGGRWSAPRNLGDRVNSRFWETQPSLTADGKALFFTSNRPGGQGGLDIWGSALRADGRWGRPVNMGPIINSEKDEHFPFFHPDGQTLYFTSDGHPGMGGNDLFWTRLDTNNVWSTPTNLGYPINTHTDETNLFVTFDGLTAYYAREMKLENRRRPNIDLYRFELPPDSRPSAVTYLKAKVVDKVSGLPLVCTVRLRPITADRSPSIQTTDTDGSFLVVLPAGKTYALVVDEPGYLFHSEQFELSGGADPRNPYRITIELEPIGELSTSSEEIILKNVLFATNSADLLPVSSDELNRLAEMLTRQADLRIEIRGHTDDVGSEVANQSLSEARAKAVFDFLLTSGIAPDRLTYNGYGETQPIATNETEEGRAQNRRTTFRILP